MILVSHQHPTNPSKRLRVLDPAARLAREHGLDVVPLETLWTQGTGPSRDTFARARALLLHFIDFNLGSEPMLRSTLALARQCRVRIVADTDDAYFMPADHGPFDAALEPHLPLMSELARKADLITVTCRPLAEEMARLQRPLRVVPNWVDPGDYRARPGHGAKLRVGFAGGPTHLLDLATVLPAIARLQRTRDFELVLFGLYDRNVRATVERARNLSASQATDPRIADFAAFARALEGVRYTHHPSVPAADFARALSDLDLDVGLCPLRDTPFNRCRSAVKFYQYAAVGTTTLASDVAPYRDECSLRCGNTLDAWEAGLARLLDDAAFRRDALDMQQQYWRAHRSWSALSPRYAEVLLGNTAPGSRGDRPA